MRFVHLVLVIICLQAAVNCEWCYVCSDNEAFVENSGWGGEQLGKCDKIRSNPPVWCTYGCMRHVMNADVLGFGRKIDTASCAEEELNLERPTFLERMKVS
uniref:Protein quiver n=1 Tax=Bursaphelenchus xylophilus TaxID=6326 RepID=A0A1I7SUU7_BURXY